jgi:hypothetical protein
VRPAAPGRRVVAGPEGGRRPPLRRVEKVVTSRDQWIDRPLLRERPL